MVLVNAPIAYQTECKVDYENLSIEEIIREYRISITKNKEKANTNNFNEYDYITNKENITTMNNSNVSYKKLDKLFNSVNKETIYLNYPIVFKIEVDENGIYYINEKYNLYVYGASQSEAEDNLVESFKEQVMAFGFEEDSKLDENAKLLKAELLKIYKYDKKKN